MYFKTSVATWILAALLVAANTHVLHEKRDTETLHGWTKRRSVPPGLSMPVRIGMTQSNLDYGAKLLLDISSPDSPNYGQHLSPGEIHDLFAPSSSTVDAIMSWLNADLQPRKISQSVNKQWIQLEASAEELEILLHTKYYIWEHLSSGKTTIACDEYSVPQHLVNHVDYITPGIKLHSSAVPRPVHLEDREHDDPQLDAVSRDLAVLETRQGGRPSLSYDYRYCAHNMTPQCIQALYNVPSNFKAIKGNDIGIFGTGRDRVSPSLLRNFFEKYYPKIPSDIRPTELYVDSPNYEGGVYNEEATLDAECAYPLIYPQNMTFWNVNDKYWASGAKFNKTTHKFNPFGQFNTWLDALDGSYCNYTAFGVTGDTPGIDPIYPDPHQGPGEWHHPLQCGVYKPTPVMSVSYYQSEQWLPVRYMERQCSEYLKLGLQGVSILFCTGDYGAGSFLGVLEVNANTCQAHSGNQKHPRDVFVPSFPASCPWVTAVGGTKLPQNSSISDYPEQAWYSSGGGFSNIWTTPDYQRKHVTHFLEKYPPSYGPSSTKHGKYPSYSTKDGKDIGANGGIFNRNGRGYPDVSAVARWVAGNTRYKGKIVHENLDGTSAATPIWAGIVTRINAARLGAGKKTVGFINPTLYANPGAFHDVTEGRTCGCSYGPNSPKGASKVGYQAAPGWDPTTGLGSPDFEKLKEVFLALP